MPIAILYFLAAGALGIGGPAGAAILFRRGQQEAALYARTKDAEAIARLLRSEIDLAALREEARVAGIDPDLVEQGYCDLRDGLVTIEQVVARLRELGSD
jgi:hypothetical protein